MVKILGALSQKPTYLRFDLNIQLYNKCTFSEFQKEEHDTLDLIYEGAKFVLSHPQLFNEEVIMLECQNLFSLMIWNKVYSEKIIQEGLITNLLSLPNATTTKIVPYMLDMLISEQIPIENRIEIALKGAFLRGGSILLKDTWNSLDCLEPLLKTQPEIFSTKCHQILEAKPINSLDTKNLSYEKEEEKQNLFGMSQKKENQLSSAEYEICFKPGTSKLIYSLKNLFILTFPN